MNLKDLNKLSEELLLGVKMKKNTSAIQSQLAQVNPNSLQSLKTDNQKKAFWINIYNAYYQILRTEKGVNKPEIYKERLFEIGGRMISLDDAEHGILRRFRYKYSLGFFASFWTSKFVKKHAVDELDYRIHFALNCGAKSCPPIAFYDPENLEEQLNLATLSFLEGESDFDHSSMVLSTTALFKWFYADFGGKKGIKKIYLEQLGKDISDFKIVYKKYSWEDDLANFT